MNIGFFISNSSVTKIVTKILSLLNLKLRGRNAAEMFYFSEEKKKQFFNKSMFFMFLQWYFVWYCTDKDEYWFFYFKLFCY
jgi:hypothetical protein